MTCFFCKEKMAESHNTYFTELNNCMIIIKNVPCLRCEQCGEVAYTGAVVRQLENIIDRLKTIVRDIAVFEYSSLIA